MSVEEWRNELELAAPDLPIDFLLAWVKHESGGNPASAGIFNKEAGIFQTYHPDDDRFGATFAELRMGAGPDFTDSKGKRRNSQTVVSPELVRRDLHVMSGIRRVRASRDAARRYVAANGIDWSEGGGDFWSLVKLHHALPGMYRFLGAFTSANGRPPSTWREWRSWVEGLTESEVVSFAPAVRPWASLGERQRIFRNAETTGQVVGNFEPAVEMPDTSGADEGAFDSTDEELPFGFEDEPAAAEDLLDFAAGLVNPGLMILAGIGLVWAVTHGIR